RRRRRAGPAGPHRQARGADPHRTDGPAVRHRAGRRPRQRHRRGRRLCRRAPLDPDPRRRRGRRADHQCRSDLRRPLRTGLPRRLLRRVQPRAPHRRVRVPLLRAVGARLPQGGARHRLLPRGPGRGGRPRRHPRRGRGPAQPRCRGPRALRRREGLNAMQWPPLRAELRGAEPYGAPQLDVPVQLNVNENPYAPSEAVVADIAAAVADAARTLNRYPDRELVELRAALADYLGHGVRPEQVWAANGSNEVMLQILQAFGGPGRTAVSFAPTYSMYPEYARNALTEWVVGHRED